MVAEGDLMEERRGMELFNSDDYNRASIGKKIRVKEKEKKNQSMKNKTKIIFFFFFSFFKIQNSKFKI